ncbi:hypothetical protein [uncultured Bacteroides sp.]|uniref:hypothetical protein n=1 Tax=uncultured Bacteroides sp. TaxID=162156 RepID=UPI0025DEB881|nr:hypothetical protein [uncultured Bacteroides sp.]
MLRLIIREKETAYLSRRNGMHKIDFLPSKWQDLAKPMAKSCQCGGKALPS